MRNRDFTGMRPLDACYHADFCVEQQRKQFDAQPPEKQQETLERVRRLLAAEARRGQVQPSGLARIAKSVYGCNDGCD